MGKHKKKDKIVVALFFSFGIIRVRIKNVAVVQRLVPLLAMQMMAVRFRSVTPFDIDASIHCIRAFFISYIYLFDYLKELKYFYVYICVLLHCNKNVSIISLLSFCLLNFYYRKLLIFLIFEGKEI